MFVAMVVAMVIMHEYGRLYALPTRMSETQLKSDQVRPRKQIFQFRCYGRCYGDQVCVQVSVDPPDSHESNTVEV